MEGAHEHPSTVAVMSGPIFVVGSPRSGTTLLRLMLTCHPHICIPPECSFAIWLYPRYQQWRTERVDDFVRDVLGCRKIETWRWDAEGLAPFLQSQRPQTYARAAELVYLWYARCQARDGVRWGDKNNFYIAHIETLREIFPDCVFVHIVRDPRSVACSYRQLAEAHIASRYAPKLPAGIEEAALHWRANIRMVTAAFGKLGWQGVYQVRFEDLVTNTRSILEHLCRSLAEPFDAGMLEYHARNRDTELEPLAFSAWKSKTQQPPICDEAERYRTELTELERQRIEHLVAAELTQFNYSF
jgi:hypothetical protein